MQRRAGDTPAVTEFQAIEALLRQQHTFMGERFDRADERLDRMEGLAQSLDTQLKLLNGTVARHALDIAVLKAPDQSMKPFLTQSEGRLLGKAVAYSVGAGATIWGVVKFVAANWGTLVPAVVGVVW